MCGSHHTAGENITTWQTGAPLCSLGCQQSVSLHSAFSQSSQVLTNPVSFTQLLLCPLSPWPMGHFHLQSTHYLDPQPAFSLCVHYIREQHHQPSSCPSWGLRSQPQLCPRFSLHPTHVQLFLKTSVLQPPSIPKAASPAHASMLLPDRCGHLLTCLPISNPTLVGSLPANLMSLLGLLRHHMALCLRH